MAMASVPLAKATTTTFSLSLIQPWGLRMIPHQFEQMAVLHKFHS